MLDSSSTGTSISYFLHEIRYEVIEVGVEQAIRIEASDLGRHLPSLVLVDGARIDRRKEGVLSIT
jgi:hypothetical protein